MESTTSVGLVPTTDELLANFRILVAWRELTGLGMVLLAAASSHAPASAFRPVPLLLLGFTQIIWNFFMWLIATRAARHVVPAAYAQALVDLAIFGLIFHFTGGIESPLNVYLMIHLFGTGLLLSKYASIGVTILAVALMAAIAHLESTGAIPHVEVWGDTLLFRNGWYVASTLGAFLISSLFLVLLSVAIASRLRRQRREAVALYQVAKVITSTLDVSKVLNLLLESCAKTLNASAGIVRLLTPDGNRLDYAAGYGLSDKYIEKGSVEVMHSPMDRRAVQGQPTIIEDVRSGQHAMYKNAMLAEGIRSGLIVPIPNFDGRTLGVLRVYSRSIGHFSASDLPFLESMTAQAGIALNNALQYQTISQIDEAKTRFLRTVTHELRAPVAGAQSLIRNLTQGFLGDLQDKQREVLLRIESRLDFLQDLITDLLDLAAGREQHLVADTHLLDLVDVTESLKRVCNSFSDQARSKKIEFSTNVDHLPALWIRAEPESLRRILTNLVSNAIKYTPAQGWVQANLRWDENWLEFTVTDSGIGIPEKDLPHLYTEFFRARNARQSQVLGTGLGLAIVKQLVTQLDGQISVRSSEGEGSTFSVFLPLEVVGDIPM